MNKPNLYEEVVKVTANYLGPAADRFVIRQISNHLQKDPEELQSQDLRKLIVWIELAMQLVTSNTDAVDDYIADLKRLAHTHKAVGGR